MGHHYGILGTPLHNRAEGEFKLSAQNRIAPIPAVYAKLKQREITKEESALLQKTSVLATKSNNLYVKDGGCVDAGELMDEEDKAHLRVRGTVRRNRVYTNSQRLLQQKETSSFLAKSAEIPEIVPKQARTIHGSGLLQRVYSIQPAEGSEVKMKPGPSTLQTVHLYSSTELRRESGIGLGYRNSEERISKSGVSRVGQTFYTLREMKDVHGFEAEGHFGYDINDDGYELANVGYKDLDSTAKLLSERLKESHGSSADRPSSKKRFAEKWTGTLDEKVWFSQFSQSQTIDVLFGDWTEYEIPSSFAVNPKHRFETDPKETMMPDMPEPLRQEYAASLKLYTENRKKEAKASRVAIAKAKEEENARSHKIRSLILEDLGSRFIEPNELQMQENVSWNPEWSKQKALCEDSSKESLKRGEAKRTNQTWKPETLLCKRLGVETGRVKLVSQKSKPLNSGKLQSSRGDDEEFLIHSVVPTSAGSSNLLDENILHGEQFVGSRLYWDLRNTDVSMGNYTLNKLSNQRLAQAIFTNTKIEDRSVEEPDVHIVSSETNLGDNSRIGRHNRGMHKTRAVDFF